MNDAARDHWIGRLEECRRALQRRGFDAHVADTPDAARELTLARIMPAVDAATISWGDSETMLASGVLDHLRKTGGHRFIVTFDPDLPRPRLIENRRRALLADLFFTGTNAVTADGRLVNLDMVGNRVAGLTFGPRKVVLYVGRNKLVPDLAAARARIRTLAAPANAIRHAIRTPCSRTATCQDCRSPQRICNVWTITERSTPPGRISVILINADLGL